MVSKIPTTLIVLAFLVIPFAIQFERAEPETWRSRLAVFSGKEEVSRHTPLHSEGTFLPPRFTQNTTLTAAANPVILSGRTEVPSGVTLTLEGGVNLFAHEFAELAVFGTLRMQGAEADPIIFTSNERHPQNQIWNGIIGYDGARAVITHTRFHYASPALTCLPGSAATLTHSEIRETLVGVFTESPNCSTQNTRIEAALENSISKF